MSAEQCKPCRGKLLRHTDWSPRVTIYLGVSCDAYSPQYGNGVWGWANGGTRVTFADGRVIGFPRQVLDDLIDRSKGRCGL